MLIIDDAKLDDLSKEAKESPRRRKNLNLHQRADDPIQRLLNALEPETYIRPHKHQDPDKMELFMLVRGHVAVVLFDEMGVLEKVVHLQESSPVKIVEIKPRVWHSVVSLAPGSIYFEIKNGPYDVGSDKMFAPWAPEEFSENANQYLNELKSAMNAVR